MLIPWSAFWERNYFGELAPLVREVITNNYLRGAITGLGLVNLWMAVGDLAEVVTTRGAQAPPGDV